MKLYRDHTPDERLILIDQAMDRELAPVRYDDDRRWFFRCLPYWIPAAIICWLIVGGIAFAIGLIGGLW